MRKSRPGRAPRVPPSERSPGIGLVAALLAVGCDRSARVSALDLGAQPPLSASARLEQLVRENLDAELAESPITATWLGVHQYDDQLDDLGADAIKQRVVRENALLDRLRQLDPIALDQVRALDRLLLERRCERTLASLTELRPHERSPVLYVDLASQSIYELLSDFAPLPDRVRAMNARMRRFHTLFEEARRNLRNPPELATRKAIELAQSTRGFIAEQLPKAVQSIADPKLADDFRAAVSDATHAIDDLIAWFQRDLLARSRGDFALGRDRLIQLLRLTEGIEAAPEALLLLGERELRESRKRFDDETRLIAAALKLGPAKPVVDVGRLLEDDHGKPEELLPQTQETLEAIVAFIKERALVPLPTPARPKVVEMPPALWGFAQLSVSGSLEPRPRDALLFIDPIDKSWNDRRKQEHLRAFNRPMVVMTLLHEAVPGHYVEGELARHAPTTMQKIAGGLTLTEGWPAYAERMMLEQGYAADDLKVRIAIDREAMLRAARLVAVVKLHGLSGKLDDAAKVFSDEAYLDEGNARREAERAALDPLILGYTLGRVALEKLREDYRRAHPDDFRLASFHQLVLSHGTIPVALLRTLLLPTDQGGAL